MYIEISDGISVRKDEVEAVERCIGNTSVVHTHHQSYTSTFSYEVLLQLLEMKEKQPVSDIQQRTFNILKGQGNFSG